MGGKTRDRRKRPAESEKVRPKTFSAREVVRIAIGSGAAGLIVGLIGASFSAAGVVSMTVAAAMLVFAWVAGTVAITVSEPVWGLAPTKRLGTSLFSIFVLAAVLFGIGWFQYKHLPIPDRGTARLGLKQTFTQKVPGTTNLNFYVNIQNDGSAIALNETTLAAGRLATTLMLPDQIDSAKNKLDSLMRDIEKTGPNHVQLAPGVGRIITLSDINNLTIDNAENTTPITISESQMADFNEGKLILYVFVLTHYEDETNQENMYWSSKACAYYFTTFSFFHNCGPLKVELVKGERFH